MPSKINKLIQTIAAFDHRAGVFTAACCARTALEVIPEGEAVPLAQIEAVEAWVRGELDAAACMATFPSGTPASYASVTGKHAKHHTRADTGRKHGVAARGSIAWEKCDR